MLLIIDHKEVCMRQERVNVWNANEYDYPASYGFIPNIHTYLHEDKARPAILVIPGGGYWFVSCREGEIVAKEFYDRGYNTFVLTYTVNLLDMHPLKMQALRDAARALRIIRAGADEYQVIPDKIAVLGFSAGGHLAASLCNHHEDVSETRYDLETISARPDAAILAYPVISTGGYAHEGTIRALLGYTCEEAEGALLGETLPGCKTRSDELNYMSLEKQVTIDTPPTFLFTTAEDLTVPPENSFMYLTALRANGIRSGFHYFSVGRHGLSLANETWATYRTNDSYTYEQVFAITKAALDGRLPVPDPVKKELLENSHFGSGVMTRDDFPVPEVTEWPEMADHFLKTLEFVHE